MYYNFPWQVNWDSKSLNNIVQEHRATGNKQWSQDLNQVSPTKSPGSFYSLSLSLYNQTVTSMISPESQLYFGPVS